MNVSTKYEIINEGTTIPAGSIVRTSIMSHELRHLTNEGKVGMVQNDFVLHTDWERGKILKGKITWMAPPMLAEPARTSSNVVYELTVNVYAQNDGYFNSPPLALRSLEPTNKLDNNDWVFDLRTAD